MAFININKVKEWFENGNVVVAGERGSGKDVLCGNVIARINRPYVATMDYTKDGKYIPLDFSKLDCGGNTWRNIISGRINYYEYPYADKTHIWISDAGAQLPSQYNTELDYEFPQFPLFMALSRHLGKCHVHVNTQDLERPWLKIREQASKKYIVCQECHVILGIVFARFWLYNRKESAIREIPPFPLKRPLFSHNDKFDYDMAIAEYEIAHGTIEEYSYICINKSKHDDRYFKQLFESGEAGRPYDRAYFKRYGLFGERGAINDRKD